MSNQEDIIPKTKDDNNHIVRIKSALKANIDSNKLEGMMNDFSSTMPQGLYPIIYGIIIQLHLGNHQVAKFIIEQMNKRLSIIDTIHFHGQLLIECEGCGVADDYTALLGKIKQ